MLHLDKPLTVDQELMQSPNLCDRLDVRDRGAIGERIWLGYYRDKNSRSKWETRMDAAMDLAMQISRAKNFPWPGCSNVVFPLVTIAALQFSARAYSGIIQGTNLVKFRTFGPVTPDSYQRAQRIGKHMSWQLMEEDESWEEQMDRLLINLAVVGSAFKKTFYSPDRRYVTGELVMAKDLILDYHAKSVEEAARKTHVIPLYRNEVYERAATGIFTDVRKDEWFNEAPVQRAEIPTSDNRWGLHPAQSDEYTPFRFLEQHTWFDLDDDGYAEPYIGTIEFNSHKLVRLTARFNSPNDIDYNRSREIVRIKAEEYFTKYSFIPSPDGGIYDLGFGLFLGPLNEAVSTAINQLLDNGTVQNSNSGFLGRGAKIRGGVYTIAPFEWKRVDSPGDDLRKNIVPLPTNPPSDVMFKLIGLLVEYANRIAGTVDATVGENPGQNTPASTYSGMQEQGLQVYRMIFKRVWRCMKMELKRRFVLNGMFTEVEQTYGSGKEIIRMEDYTGSPGLIAPVANPNLTSNTMRIQQVVMAKQDAAMTPGYDMAELTKDFLEALEVEGIERVFPGPGKVPQGNEMQNPKAMQAQMKFQEVQLKLKEERLRWAYELLEQQRVNNAKIRLDEANALKSLAEAGGAAAAAQLEAYTQMVEQHEKINNMVNERVRALLGEASGGQSDAGAGVRGVERQSSDQGDQTVPAQIPGGSQGSVGNGKVPEGVGP